MASKPEELSLAAREVITNVENDLYVSICSIWEMQIKHQLGKLDLNVPIQTFCKQHRDSAGINLLGIDEEHIWKLETLPKHHNDPFDRLLIAQACLEGMPLITADKKIISYNIETVW